MKPVFADTSYYVALVNPSDHWHARAIGFSADWLGRVFTTEYILVEMASMLCRGENRNAYLALLQDIQADPSVVVEPATTSLFTAGLKLFAARPDKDWSLVDCISFVVMKQRRLKVALTADRHFIQAGFDAVLREGIR